jgi:hypothetical protein
MEETRSEVQETEVRKAGNGRPLALLIPSSPLDTTGKEAWAPV